MIIMVKKKTTKKVKVTVNIIDLNVDDIDHIELDEQKVKDQIDHLLEYIEDYRKNCDSSELETILKLYPLNVMRRNSFGEPSEFIRNSISNIQYIRDSINLFLERITPEILKIVKEK